ncbi:hypothetical protein OHT59_22110 [Streptomyces sp. NBC_00243]|uniref:P-loop NTPase n=1 Tax=Streptomyces sp. NBC_00243 TaxID=2975688 RepID=UPI002DD7A45C|nr:hypothetical protein [Streptomyces sp. NBC_00243]WRZ21009.1 hypothetical protein OHT59_22110 [Streptomyces sp. NBC_00243]
MTSGFTFSDVGASDIPIPVGWELVTRNRLEQIDHARDLTSFFDGTNPDWQTVLHPNLRLLTVTENSLARARHRLTTGLSGVELFRGPSGEGKSTALLQVAKELVLADDVYLVWRRDPAMALKTDEVEQLITGPRRPVFVADSAENLIGDITKILTAFDIGAGQSIQFILAARATDWVRSMRSRKLRIDPVNLWRRTLEVNDCGDFDRVNEADATSIMESWKSCSPSLPERVRNVPQEEAARVIVQTSLGRQKGSGALLGALLKIRFTAQGLSSHIASVLDSLVEVELPSGKTLADLLVALSAVDVANQDGIPREVLAAYAEIPESEIRVKIEIPLGREAVLGSSAGMLHGRHKLISKTIFDLAMDEHNELSTEASLDDLIVSTAKVGEVQGYRMGFGRIFDVPQDLAKATTKAQWSNQFKELLVGRAKTVVRFQPDRLMSYVALSGILRSVGQPRVAEEEVWNSIGSDLLTNDWTDSVDRGAWVEFATVLSFNKQYAKAAWASAMALADFCSSPLKGQMAPALSVYTLNLKEWHQKDSTVPTGILPETFALFRATNAGRKSISYVSRSCDALGLSMVSFSGVPHFMQVFLASLDFVTSKLDGEWIRERIGGNDPRYSILENVLSREEAGRSR